jgi:hypothetical protein
MASFWGPAIVRARQMQGREAACTPLPCVIHDRPSPWGPAKRTADQVNDRIAWRMESSSRQVREALIDQWVMIWNLA